MIVNYDHGTVKVSFVPIVMSTNSNKFNFLRLKEERLMNVLRIKVFTLCTIAFLAFGIIGCNEGSGEKTGKEIDQAIESTKDKIHEATK